MIRMERIRNAGLMDQACFLYWDDIEWFDGSVRMVIESSLMNARRLGTKWALRKKQTL